MNERDRTADEFERAQKDVQPDAPALESFPEPDNRAELATAYSRRSRRAGGPPLEEEAARTLTSDAAPVEASQSEFRLRDFRPDTSAPSVPVFGTPPTPAKPEPMRDVPQWSAPTADEDGHLSYHTQAVPMAARPAAPAPAVVDSVPAEFAAPPRPMTRRELRELEARQGTRSQADDAPAVAPAPAPASAPVAFAEPAPAVPEEPAELILPPVARLAPPIPVPAPTPVLPPSVSVEPSLPAAQSPEPVVFTDASGGAPAKAAPAPMPVSRGIDSAPEIFTAMDAHWPTPSATEAPSQPGDSFFRTVGSNGGPLTTSALVIPSIPQASDITRPFSRTGEILITGSIDLPMSLGATGGNAARLDHADIDALFAQEDHEYAPADAAPVRAIRAVSTHTSTHGVISAKKPASNRLPMMMAVTAGVLAVGVASLFAVGMIFGYF